MTPARETLPPLDVLVVGDAAATDVAAPRTAVVLAGLGARVRLLTVLGDDPAGRSVLRTLGAAGVHTADVLLEPGRDTGGPRRVDPALRNRLGTRLHRWAAAADVVVVVDTRAGLLDGRAVRTVASLRHPAVVVDSRTPMRWAGVRPRAVRTELADVHPLLGQDQEPPVRLDGARTESVLTALGTGTVCLGTPGGAAWVLERAQPPRTVPADEDAGLTAALTLHVAGLGTIGARPERVIHLDPPPPEQAALPARRPRP